jgi:DeoR/GlpR family transcriptional regulator of sugar metabolism
MRTDRFRSSRRAKIFELLQAHSPLSVGYLVSTLGVTGATIRADLQALSLQHSVIRTHGGAVRGSAAATLPLENRLRKNNDKKKIIGKAAAQLVKNGDHIALDASSTALAVIPFLASLTNVTVVALTIAAAGKLMHMPGIRVILPGGELRAESSSLVGPQTLAFLKKIRIKTSFIGAQALDISQGLYDVDMSEAEVKKALIQISEKSVAIVDSSKWDEVALAPFASFKEISIFITDKDCPPLCVQKVRSMGVDVILA